MYTSSKEKGSIKHSSIKLTCNWPFFSELLKKLAKVTKVSSIFDHVCCREMVFLILGKFRFNNILISRQSQLPLYHTVLPLWLLLTWFFTFSFAVVRSDYYLLGCKVSRTGSLRDESVNNRKFRFCKSFEASRCTFYETQNQTVLLREN
jgi:hypothetical protein